MPLMVRLTRMALTSSEATQRPCQSLEMADLPGPRLYRFVLGEDEQPSDELEELGDVFGAEVLGAGRFPRTALELLDQIDAAGNTAVGRSTEKSFVVGEGINLGGQADSNLRVIVTRGEGADGPDLMLSAGSPQATSIEVMAWDPREGGFNFYRTANAQAAWIFAGRSRHALESSTERHGVFESHRSGTFLMKELTSPWTHWHSSRTPAPDDAMLPEDLRGHRWVLPADQAEGTLHRADDCEKQVARPAIRRWAKHRLAGQPDAAQLRRAFRQLLQSDAVNLSSSPTSSATIEADSLNLPSSFFFDSEAFRILGLPGTAAFQVEGRFYAETLRRFKVRLEDGRGFTREGDTQFAFLVPERAEEDQAVLRELVGDRHISKRLAACLLMVDFPNPVFSARRRSLLSHLPEEARSPADFSEAFRASIEGGTDDSAGPEAEFGELWAASETVCPSIAFEERLRAYYDAVAERLKTPDGIDDIFKLAESRRAVVRAMPIHESRLLFATSRISSDGVARTMTSTATLIEDNEAEE